MGESTFAQIGEVTPSKILEIYGLKGDRILAVPVAQLKEAWQRPLDW
jgi:hypothetical protein